jgi:uncharacterized protein (TIGR02453 family)
MRRKFSSKTIPFLKKAGQQTSSDWLDENQNEYQELLRLPFIDLAEGLKEALLPFAPNYHFPTKGIGRIKRAANKVMDGQPHYKDWLSLSASKPSGSRFERNPHLFFGMLPNEPAYQGVIVAGGLFMPSSPQLKKVRSAIAADSEPFHRLFCDREFKARFKSGFIMTNSASRVPRGFDADHPDLDWIKLKSFLVQKKISLTEFTSHELVDQIVKDFKQLVRLNRLIEDVLDGK